MKMIKRGFIELEEGQIHYRTLGDLKNSLRPLVMIHASPTSASSLQPLMTALASLNRLPIYAPDTPGNGDSCKPNRKNPDICYYADAVSRQLSNLGIRECNIYGTHTGGSIAIELAIQKPKLVKKLVVDGIGMYSEKEKSDMLKNYAPEIKPDLMGTQINWAWHFILYQNFFFPWYRNDIPKRQNYDRLEARATHETVVEVLKSIESYHNAYRAAFRYPKREKLALIEQPILLIYSKDDPLYKYRQVALRAAVNVTDGKLHHSSSVNDKAKLIDQWLSDTK